MNKQPSTALIVAVTIVAVSTIASITLILITLDKSELPEGWLGLFLGFLGSLIVAVLGLAKIDRVDRKVDDLSNGLMDAKIRAGVADVLAPHLIDPTMDEQLRTDAQRRRSVK